ncbi:Synaptotagmin-9 [Cricetulus griseus]|uniref:Synaptotagmin-9 n=1 Tax=Cricetulus griseus TaxID=10029 RepID=G3IGJ8_CRIGR|nr:Synaptotagmin-9 [Cricetulus griseus]
MTLTVIKCRNLKAMDITGSSDPYVKVSLMCEGRRLKKRKTTTKKNTLNPVYNEAIIFDIPPENVDQVSLCIAVMDYDRDAFRDLPIYASRKKDSVLPGGHDSMVAKYTEYERQYVSSAQSFHKTSS